jgi:thiosulfate/3-mercaptopyruvate sulfurtransferase
MPERVVSLDWLADHRDDPALHVVDVRDAWEYEGIGHVPGAVSIPFDEFRDEGGDDRGMLPGADAFADLMEGAGIERDDRVVAYDDDHGVFAARVLVTAELYGHPTDRLHLLDGDFSAWMREREVTNDLSEVEPSAYEVVDPEETPLIEFDGVEDAIEDPETVIVDTREDWEYEEGHIPGAIRLDWRELVDEESRGLLEREELLGVLEAHGITSDRRIVLYCNTARRISHTYWVLSWLGYDDVRFYEGSLTEWERAGGELETGGD